MQFTLRAIVFLTINELSHTIYLDKSGKREDTSFLGWDGLIDGRSITLWQI
jgi:hypothetical protein